MVMGIEERTIDISHYIIDKKATVRAAASHFGVSKSTVHKDLSERLPRLNTSLYESVRQVLDTNKLERHIRGGIATKKHFEELRSYYGKNLH